MDTKTNIAIISVRMNKTTLLFNTLTQMLQETCDEANVHTSINIQSTEELEDRLISYTELNTIDIILVLACSLKDEIKEKINAVDAKIKIKNYFAEIPIFLHPTISESLHYAYRKKTLIYFVFGNESDIMDIVQMIKDSIVLAAYLLRNIHSNCNESNHSHKREDEMSCSDDVLSFSLKEDEEEDMSLSFDSPTASTSPISTADIYHRSTPISQMMCPSMISIDEALKIITDTFTANVNVNKTAMFEIVNIKDAFGRRSFKAVMCSSNVPSFSVATKDGYAVSITNTEAEKIEGISDESNKDNSIILDPNTTIRINSGEFIPLGAIAVIPTNNVKIFHDYKGNEVKTTSHPIKYGQNIIFPGDDIKKEEIIVHSDICMGSMEIGLLATCDWKEVLVIKKAPIGVLTIGDKLQEPGKLKKHLYDSSWAFLTFLLKENGFNSVDLDISIVDLTTITQNITAALETVNLLVITRRSKDKDYLKTILKNHFNATLHFENINIKPGKSTTFASCKFNDTIKYILCLPGNPESALIIAHLFLLPLVKMLHGITDEKSTIILAKIKHDVLLHSRPRYVWATLSWSKKEYFAEIHYRRQNNSISNKLSNIINANALLMLPAKTPEVDRLKISSFVSAILVKFPISK